MRQICQHVKYANTCRLNPPSDNPRNSCHPGIHGVDESQKATVSTTARVHTCLKRLLGVDSLYAVTIPIQATKVYTYDRQTFPLYRQVLSSRIHRSHESYPTFLLSMIEQHHQKKRPDASNTYAVSLSLDPTYHSEECRPQKILPRKCVDRDYVYLIDTDVVKRFCPQSYRSVAGTFGPCVMGAVLCSGGVLPSISMVCVCTGWIRVVDAVFMSCFMDRRFLRTFSFCISRG